MTEQGVVVSFDEPVGLGVVRSNSGVEYLFHCTQISDGTRTIDQGVVVSFTVNADRPHGPEAYQVSRL